MRHASIRSISLVFQKVSVEQHQMPKRSRKEDQAKSMSMAIKPPLEPLRAFKKLVVHELIKEGKVIVHKRKN